MHVMEEPVKKLNLIAKYCLLSSGLVFSVLASASASAAAIQLFHAYSARAVADGDSGGAALADDATTTYTNPAGLIRLPRPQLIFSAVNVSTNLKFTGSNTWSRTGFPSYTQTGSAQGGISTVLPAIFLSAPITDRLSFGFSTVSPFGLKTIYSSDSIVRYSGTKGEITVIDLSPALSFKVNNHFSMGAGIDFDRVIAHIQAVIGAPSVFGTSFDSYSQNSGYGWGYGGHFGMLYQMNQQTRFGLAHRTRVSTKLTGSSILNGRLVSFVGIPNGTIQLRSFNGKLVFPPTTTLSGYHDINPNWAVQGSVNYIQWSSLPTTLSLNNVAALPPTSSVTVSIPQHYSNTWYLAGGANFKANEHWLLRAGLSFDQTPVKNSERNVLLPDGNRIATSLGAHYQPNKNIGFDVGWSHFFIQDASINLPTVFSTQTSTTVGKYKSSGDLVGAQVEFTL